MRYSREYTGARRAVGLLLSCTALLFTPAPKAQEAATSSSSSEAEFFGSPILLVDGIDPVFSNKPTLPETTPEPDESLRLQDIDKYSELVNEIERDLGVWNESLVEELMQLGALYQSGGEHANAITTFDRALYVTRIHDGLHTLQQVDIVNQLLTSYEAMGDWQQVDKYEEYLFYTQLKAFGPNDARLIPVIQRLADWRIRAFRLRLGELYGLHLFSAELLYTKAAELAEFHFEEDPEHHFAYNKRGVAKVAYLILANAQIMQEITHLQEPTRRSLQDKLQMSGRVQFALSREFQTGARVLEEVSDYFLQHELMEEHIRALVDRADWEISRRRTNQAESLYAEARALLAETDDPVGLETELFTNPVKIPVFIRPMARRDSGEIGLVEIGFDLSIRGELAGVEVLTPETEENILHLRKLKSDFRSSIYRPQLIDGELRRARGLKMAFQYLY